MSKKRVHEIAKEHGISSKELLQRLNAAGIEAKAAASSVEEAAALKALASGSAAAKASNGQPSPSVISRLITSGTGTPRYSATSLTVEPELTRTSSVASSAAMFMGAIVSS